MNIFSLSGLINGIGASLIGVFVYIKNRKNPLNISYALFCLSVAAWSYCYYFWPIAVNKESALFWFRALHIGAILIPIFYFHFILYLLNLYEAKRKILLIGYMLAAFFLLFDFSPFYIKDMAPKFIFKYWAIPGILYHFFLIYFFYYIVYPCHLMFRVYKVSTGIKREQIKYVLLGTIVGYGGGSTNYPLWYNIPVYPYGNLLIPVYLLITAYAILRYRLMDIRVAVTRLGIFVFVYILVLGIPFIIGYYTKSWIISTFSMALLATLGPFIYSRLRKKAEDFLLAQQHRYQKTLIQASSGMVKIRELKRLLNLIVHIITKTVRVKKALIFLENEKHKSYELKATRLSQPTVEIKEIGCNSSLIKYLQKTRQPLLLEEVEQKASNNRRDGGYFISLLAEMRALDVILVVPSFIEDRLLGFLALGGKLSGDVFSPEDVGVFKILSYQAALAIENARFLEEFKKAQERIFQADKLASIGAMADGVAHQINNRLQVFLAVAGDLKDLVQQSFLKDDSLASHKEDFNYLLYGLDKVVENAKHLSQVISGILGYARTEKDSAFRSLSLQEVIPPVLGLMQVKHDIKDGEIEIHIPSDIPPLRGSLAQLSEAFFNLLDNAYEAVEEKQQRLDSREGGFSKKIVVSATANSSYLRLTISDNGIGIKPEDFPKIFAPFYTTKSSAKSGTGLGMYVVKRIIEENHRGRIRFESQYQKGTTFYIELPLSGN